MSENLKKQYALLENSAVFSSLASGEEILRWQGSDVVHFLNNYNSQDIKKLQNFESALGAFLSQKGKIISDVLILKFPEYFLLIFEAGYGSQVLKHLDVYLGFSSVEINKVNSEYAHLALMGAKSSEILSRFFSTFSPSTSLIQTLSWKSTPCFAFKSERLGREAWEILASPSIQKDLEAAWQEAGAEHAENELLEILRVEAALPRIGVDMSEENLLAEVGLDKRATSFTKGCYLGQETTARVNTQGRVHKKLSLFRLEKMPSGSLPFEIASEGKTVGKITSLIESPKQGPLGLGLIQSQVLEAKTPIQLLSDEKVLLYPLAFQAQT